MEIPVMHRASQYKHGRNKDNNKNDARTMQEKSSTTRIDNTIRTFHRGKRTAVLCLVILMNLAVAGSCPSHCSCSAESIAFCNNKHFTSTPSDFTSVIERLYLFNNNISTISPRSLEPLKNLKLLDLSGNRISNYALWKGIFSQLKLLENLMLQENQIARITKDMFSGLTNLARIYLQDNQIIFIEDGAFNNLPNLVELKLRNNRLGSFPRIRDTPNLLLLDLGFNRLTRIRDLALSTVNLEHLKLQSNQLTQLRTSVFDDTSRLTQLDISDNRLTAVPQVIKSFTSLRALNMSANKVGTIPVDTFKGMNRLKALYLQNMGLKSLPYGIIPPRVILNVLNISDNDWDCECSMHWLPQYIRIFEQAFARPNDIICSTTSKLSGRKVKDLTDDDFECTEEEIVRTLHPTTKSTTATPITQSAATRKPWVPDPCDVFTCFFGGTCYVSENLPKCRCARHRFGQQCRKPRFPATTRTTTTKSPSRVTESKRASQKPQLLINEDSITEDSVEIILPQTETELVISVSEIGQDKNPTELTIKPVAHPFTVKGLDSGKFYNICVHLPLLDRKDRLPPYLDRTDTLCGSVKTDGIRVIKTPVVTTKITVVPSPGVASNSNSPIENTGKDDKNVHSNKPGHGDKHQGNANPDTTPTESTEFKIIYPAVGAGIGAVIIVGLVITFFVCYRKKRMQKFKNHGSPDYLPASPADGTQMVDMEMATVVHHHHHNHYNAGGAEGNNVPKTAVKKQNTPYKKQKNQQGNFTNNNSGKKSVTPNKTASLGRSSNSSANSSSGTLQSRYVDSPSQYPPQQQQQPYITPGMSKHPQYEAMPPQRNGRGSEYIYRNHQNNNNSAMQLPGGRYMPLGLPYDPELMDEMQPLTGGMNQLSYIPGEGPMYQDAYPMSPRGDYIPPTGPISYPQNNSRSAFQPIQGPRKNTVGTPTSESGPITTHVNTAHVLPTSTCLSRNLMSENLSRYPEGVPVV